MSEKEMVDQLLQLTNKKELLKEELEYVNEQILLAKEKLTDHLHQQGADRSRTYEGIGFVSLYADTRPRCPDELKPDFYQWLRDQGRDDLIKENVHWMSLKNFVDETMTAGGDLPDYLELNGQVSVKLYKEN